MRRSSFVRGLSAGATMALSPSLARPAIAAQTTAFIQNAIDTYLANAGLPNLGIVVGVVSPQTPAGIVLVGGSIVSARQRQPMTLDATTPFLIGSNTKCFTSRAYAMRQSDYDKTIGDCIGLPLPPRLRAVRILDLARYSSGFPTDNSPPVWWNGAIDGSSLPALLASLNAHPQLPPCTPGSAYSYSNFAWGLIGLAALGVSDPRQPVAAQWAGAIADLAHDVGLSPTTAPWNARTVDTLPAGYGTDGLFPQTETYGAPNWLVLGGGGNLVSSGDDMLRWLRYNMGISGRDVPMLMNQQVRTWQYSSRVAQTRGVAACAVVPVAAPVTTSLGWFHPHAAWNPSLRYLTKNGGVKGFSSWMAFQSWAGTGAASRFGVFALANGPKAADVVGSRVFRSLF